MSTTTTEKKTAKKTAAKKAETEASAPAAAVIIDRIAVEKLLVPIAGTTPLIMHKFSEKAKKQILDNMQGVKRPKEPKNPDAEYEAAFYRFGDGRYGFPAIAFKSATIGGARYYGKSVSMTALRQYIFVNGEAGEDGQQLVVIDGEPGMREDVVRVGMGGSDLRYRPQFLNWKTTLEVTYVTSSLTRESLISLIDAGGMGVGVGEWRPEKKGDFGTYRIDDDRDIQVVTQ